MKLPERQKMSNNRDSWNEGELFLRYNRDERLKRSSESVRQMYAPDYIKRLTLIKSLTAMRSSRSTLFAILIVCALSFGSVFLHLNTARKSGKICGIPVKLEYLNQQERLYVNVSFKSTAQGEDYALPVTVRFCVMNNTTERQEVKTVEAIYIGSALTLPVQFSAHGFNRLEAVIAADGKVLTLQDTLKEE